MLRGSSFFGNRGYRKYLLSQGARFVTDEEAVRREARYDGKWVLCTNTDLTAVEVALKYKQLWTVEELFRQAKSLLATRPIFHRCDETIRGHVFCSFLALILHKEIQARLEARGEHLEWDDIVRDLDTLTETDTISLSNSDCRPVKPGERSNGRLIVFHLLKGPHKLLFQRIE